MDHPNWKIGLIPGADRDEDKLSKTTPLGLETAREPGPSCLCFLTQVPHQQALDGENQTGSENRPSQVKSILMENKVKTMKKTIQSQDSN